MPRLPDLQSLGPSPTPRPSRGAQDFERAGGGIQQAANIQARAAGETGAGLMALGKSGMTLADQFAQAEQRIQNRQDAVEHARAVSAYTEDSAAKLRLLQTEGDLGDVETGRKYVDDRRAALGKMVEGFGGSPDGQARLHARLEGIRTHYTDQAAILGVEAGKQRIAGTLLERSNAYAEQARLNPSRLTELFVNVETDLGDHAGGLEPHEERTYRINAQSDILTSAFNGLLDRRDIAGAERILLDTPGVDKLLKPSARAALYTRIREAREQMAAKKNEGYTLSPGQRRYNEANQVVAENPADPKAGEGTQWERLRSSFATTAPLLATGNLTPRQESEFVADIINYIQPQPYTDPDTGRMLLKRNMIPGYLADALTARGYKVPPETISDVTRDTDTATGKAPKKDAAATEPVRPSGQTIYEMAGDVTGLIARSAEFIGGLPVVGGRAPEYTAKQQQVTALQGLLVRTLQQNPRYAEGEREAIAKEVNIVGKFIDDPAAYQQRLIGLDDALEIRYQNAIKTAQADKIGRDERIQAMNVANAIMNFRASMLPPRFDDPTEAQSWAASQPSGAPFLFRQGKSGGYTYYLTGEQPKGAGK